MPKESIALRMNQADLGQKSERELRALVTALFDALNALAAKLDGASIAGGNNAAEVAKFITK